MILKKVSTTSINPPTSLKRESILVYVLVSILTSSSSLIDAEQNASPVSYISFSKRLLI